MVTVAEIDTGKWRGDGALGGRMGVILGILSLR